MLDLLGGFAILYLLLCLIPSAIGAALGCPYPKFLYIWMVLTGWSPVGWLGAALFISVSRRPVH